MNVLIVGGGGKEHALAKTISTSIKCATMYAPEAGISKIVAVLNCHLTITKQSLRM